MNDETAEQLSSRRQSLSLSSLYLDPNNFRIVDHPDYVSVPPQRVFDSDVQRRTTSIVLGRQQENVRDLIASIKANGWLEIDPILVQRMDKGRFPCNRRQSTRRVAQALAT